MLLNNLEEKSKHVLRQMKMGTSNNQNYGMQQKQF